MRLTVKAPPRFRLLSTVLSHGWADLPPFSFDHRNLLLSRTFDIGGGRSVMAGLSQRRGDLVVNVQGVSSLSSRGRAALLAGVRSVLRLDEDLREFYAEADSRPGFRWVRRLGAGRLMRAPTVFEDVVRMICTTNCSWALTKIMVGNLCSKVAPRRPGAPPSFPSAQAMAERTERFFRREVRAGYRSPYLLELARRVARGQLPIEKWRNGGLPEDELRAQMASVKGMGPYARGNILKLLGRYDELGIDSWCRRQFSVIHRGGRPVSDAVIERHYAPYGRWKGLFFWLDLTAPWYRKPVPEIFGG